MKTKNILKHPSELRRTLKAFFTFYKYLFGREGRNNKSKFESKFVSARVEAKETKKSSVESESKIKSVSSKVSSKETVI